MNSRPTPIAGVFVVETTLQSDERGAFGRMFCHDSLAPILSGRMIAQINHSRTAAPGTVRGMHFQHAPHAEMKLVRCLRGRVWDVVVDVRAGSATFLHWYAEMLDKDSARMMVIPEGCAHGFQALEPDSELLYLHTASYAPAAEGGLRPDDPRLNIPWPMAMVGLSPRDRSHDLIPDDFPGIDV